MFIIPALVGLALSCAWVYYIFRNDADNDVGTIKVSDPISIGFLVLYGLSCFYTYHTGPQDMLYYSYSSFYVSMLLSIAYVDIKTGYLYDRMLGFYAVLLAGLSCLIDFERLKSGLVSMLIVFVFYGLIYVLARLFYKREAFGTGDIFFVTVVVMNMQPLQSVVLAFMAFYIAAIYLLIKYLMKGREAMSAEIAFCPYIAFAGLIMFLFEAKVLGLLALLFY